MTTRVDIYNMGYEATIRSVRESFDLLGRLDGGIDLVLIHWPCPFVSKDVPGAVQKYSSLRKSTWEALEKLQQDGAAKQIGVSNFGKRHLRELLETKPLSLAHVACYSCAEAMNSACIRTCRLPGVGTGAGARLGSGNYCGPSR